MSQVLHLPDPPCEPAGEDDLADDFCHYCEAHDRLVCKRCHRHALEDEGDVEPREPFHCPVHGIIARMGYP